MLSTNTSVIWGDLPGIKDWWNSSPDAQMIFDFFGIMFDCLFRQVLMKEGITDSDDLPAYFLAQSPGSCSVLIGKSKDGTEHDNDRKNGQRF